MRLTEKTAEILKSSGRYKDFVLLDKPVRFDEFFAGKDADVVQLHSIQLCGGDDIVGFCGACSWKDGVLEPLDHDSYSEKMPIFGYSWWSNKKEGIEKGLDILVGDEW